MHEHCFKLVYFYRLKKIQEKKKILRKKAEALKIAKGLAGNFLVNIGTSNLMITVRTLHVITELYHFLAFGYS